MAMNKAEKAELEAAKNEAAMARALCWPTHNPKPLSPSEIQYRINSGGGKDFASSYSDGTTKALQGWGMNEFRGDVFPMAATAVSGGEISMWNGKVYASWTKSNAGFWLHKADALAALRYATTMTMARRLVAIDTKISEADEE